MHRAFGRWVEVGVDHYAGSQVAPDQAQQTFVSNLAGDTIHQHVVLYGVKEFGKVHIDAPAVAGTDVLLNEVNGFVSRTFWSKAETRFRKARIEDRRQDQQDGLLNETIHDIGNAEMPLTAITPQKAEHSGIDLRRTGPGL